MPTPIPTNYNLYMDPLLGFTPGGTTWIDQSINEQGYTFNNTNYTYEYTIGSFLLPAAGSNTTVANQDSLPGAIPIGTSAITIIAWVKINSTTMANGDFFTVYTIGRNQQSGVQESRLICLRVSVVDNGPGNSLTICPAIYNSLGYRLPSFTPGANTTYWTDSNWHMISMTKVANGTVTSQKLYVDGVEITAYGGGSVNYTVNTSINNTPAGLYPRIRINENNQNTYPSSIPGSIGQLWVYNQVLTQADLLNFWEVTKPRYYPQPTRSFAQGFNG